jgi:hypothetical protein
MSAGGRAAYIAGLRMLADKLEQNEDIPLPRDGGSASRPLAFGLLHHVTSGEEFAAVFRALGGEGWRQEVRTGSGLTWLDVTGRLAGLWVEVSATADKVCKPIPPQPVIERKCAALDAFLAEAGRGGES